MFRPMSSSNLPSFTAHTASPAPGEAPARCGATMATTRKTLRIDISRKPPSVVFRETIRPPMPHNSHCSNKVIQLRTPNSNSHDLRPGIHLTPDNLPSHPAFFGNLVETTTDSMHRHPGSRSSETPAHLKNPVRTPHANTVYRMWNLLLSREQSNDTPLRQKKHCADAVSHPRRTVRPAESRDPHRRNRAHRPSNDKPRAGENADKPPHRQDEARSLPAYPPCHTARYEPPRRGCRKIPMDGVAPANQEKTNSPQL